MNTQSFVLKSAEVPFKLRVVRGSIPYIAVFVALSFLVAFFDPKNFLFSFWAWLFLPYFIYREACWNRDYLLFFEYQSPERVKLRWMSFDRVVESDYRLDEISFSVKPVYVKARKFRVKVFLPSQKTLEIFQGGDWTEERLKQIVSIRHNEKQISLMF